MESMMAIILSMMHHSSIIISMMNHSFSDNHHTFSDDHHTFTDDHHTFYDGRMMHHTKNDVSYFL